MPAFYFNDIKFQLIFMLQVTYKKQTNKYKQKIEEEVGMTYQKVKTGIVVLIKLKSHHYVFLSIQLLLQSLQSIKLTMIAMDKKYVVMALERYRHCYPCFYAFWQCNQPIIDHFCKLHPSTLSVSDIQSLHTQSGYCLPSPPN